jgi:hypothetical protein
LLAAQVARIGQGRVPVIGGQAKNRQDQVRRLVGVGYTAALANARDKGALVDPSARMRGSREQGRWLGLGNSPGERTSPNRQKVVQRSVSIEWARTGNLASQPSPHNQGKQVHQIVCHSRRRVKKLAGARRQGRSSLLEIGWPPVAETRDRIDAPIDILEGLVVLDQLRAEFDQRVDVLDRLEPARRIKARDLSAIEFESRTFQSLAADDR